MIHEPPHGGAVFRLIHFLPRQRNLSNADALRMHALLKSSHVPSASELTSAKDPTMHKTNTLNYMALLSGELWMLTEVHDVLLKAGDVLIQSGGIHGWRNDGSEPAVLLAILVDAIPV